MKKLEIFAKQFSNVSNDSRRALAGRSSRFYCERLISNFLFLVFAQLD